ncbi:MAG TPA: protein kinase, partial [Kofleriaceae bacterium]
IGGGPNGVVARAKVFGVAGFERQFAIKRFLPELTANPSTAQALSAAARSYGGLEHPRIARMSEFGVAQGQTFTAVELVAGLDLQRLVAESRLSGQMIGAGGALALISQAARAVGYAHGRGLSHLGLSPTNVIVTTEGDVKVTDFGILAATIPAKPIDAPRLAPRIGYLAPEQIVGEATSAATDVFVLGIIAYELVTGQRAYFAESPADIASKILAGPPADPPLPRPIVRVLARCLARSQFERFPDARAFADALDAALRVAPVPGTRKDVGAQVKTTLDRHAAMNEGNLSGVVALNLTAPSSLGPSSTLADMDLRSGLPPEDDGIATTNFVRPDVEVPGPTPLTGPADLAKPLTTTMPGVPMPPPIPSLGAPAKKQPPQIPTIKPKSAIPSIVPPALRPVGAGSKITGMIPTLRQTQPGTGPEPVAGDIDEFGRARAKLVGPTPGQGAPGRPGSNLEIKNETGLRPGSENDVQTLPGNEALTEALGLLGSEFGSANDEATRPGQYARAESDFSDLAAEVPPPPPSPTADAFARGAKGLQPRPALQPLAPRRNDPMVADPPTQPHDVLPEVHARGGLAPFARQKADPAEITGTSPSIEIIPSESGQFPRASTSTNPPFQTDSPTGEMTPELARELR